MQYQIKKIEMLRVAELTPHPDALAMGASDDDRGALDVSIDNVGLLEPLFVIKNDGGSGWLVIDGVGRLKSADEADYHEVPCVEVECSDVRMFAAHKNAMGRKRSTGSRILCYVLANSEKVLGAEGGAKTPHETFAEEGGIEIDKHNKRQFWSIKRIAERMKISREDVGLAIELLRCQQLIEDEDGNELEHDDYSRLMKVFNAVLSAQLPIRRWRSAFAGAMNGTQKGTGGRAAADYAEVMERSVKSIKNVFSRWPEVEWASDEQKKRVGTAFAEALMAAPDAMRLSTSKVIADRWPEADLRAMQKLIKQRLGK